jgi:hypothetical protein
MHQDSLKVVIESSKQVINIFGFSIDIVVFTVLTPIIIFILGQWLLRRNDKIKERNKLYDIRLYFYSQVDTLIKATIKQKENLNVFIDKLKEERIQNLNFALSSDFQIKHLEALPKTDLFTVIVSKEKKNRDQRLSTFWKCQQSFDLVDWHSKNFQNRFDYIFSHSSDYGKLWNESIKYIGNFHDRWISEAINKGFDITKDPFLSDVWKIFHEWVKYENFRDMYVADKQLIKPLIVHCKKQLPNYFALILLEELLKAKEAVDNHRNLRNISVVEFESYIVGLDKIHNDLSESLKELKETQKY